MNLWHKITMAVIKMGKFSATFNGYLYSNARKGTILAHIVHNRMIFLTSQIEPNVLLSLYLGQCIEWKLKFFALLVIAF
jgi:hypothetical protein